MKSRDILKAFVADPNKPASSSEVSPRSSPVMKEMGRSLDFLGEEAAAARELREKLAAGDHVVDIDPKLVEESFLRDRIAIDGQPDPVFDELQRSIAENGQQVPILVRPHPENANRYQVAYGHRRLRAAGNLGLPVRALVRQLSDDELILAQGQENGARVDLSFIEKALFALRMEGRGFDRQTISKTLSMDKADVSRLLQIATDIPSEIIIAIGPAPKIGRPRWLAMAEKMRDDSLLKIAQKEAKKPDFAAGSTDKRFERLWRALTYRAPDEATVMFKGANGSELATITKSKRSGKVSITSTEFTEFLALKMPDLIKEFEKG